MNNEYILILSTFPDLSGAKQIARLLVESGVSACVNVIPSIASVYRWKGVIECQEECLLIIKTRVECFPAVRDKILGQHPYELPEVIAVPVVDGFDKYLRWIDSALQHPHE
ncbi:MAG: divalent-cation tolerance protein CutA [Gammaproteobacteria bacterium]